MIITVLELMKEGKALQVKEIPCYDEALNIAFGISDVLNSHYRVIDSYLEEHGKDIVPPTTTQQHTEEEELAATLHEQGLSLRKIAVELYNDEGKFMKVKRMLARMGIAA